MEDRKGLDLFLGDAADEITCALFYFSVFYPLLKTTVQYLKRKQANILSSMHMFWILMTLTSVTVAIVLGYYKQYDAPSAYTILQVNRFGKKYSWAKKYVSFQKQYHDGTISKEAWTIIDHAYDMIYNNKVRKLYNAWGEDFEFFHKDNEGIATFLNAGLFYFIWGFGIYCVSLKEETKNCVNYCSVPLLLIFGVDFAVKFMYWNPKVSLLSRLAPYQLVQYLHRLYPAYLIFCAAYTELYFVDMQKYKMKLFNHMLKNNERATEALHEISDSLKNETDEEDK